MVPEDVTFIRADVEEISWGSDGRENDTGDDTRSGEKGGVGGRRGRGSASGRLCGGTSSTRPGDGSSDGDYRATPRWKAEFDLLVGADGPNSFVRNDAMLVPLGAEAATVAAAAAAAAVTTPQRRGYVVYRGVCSRRSAAAAAATAAGGEEGGREDWGLESFQTWGPGLRFASVPLAGDERVRGSVSQLSRVYTRIRTAVPPYPQPRVSIFCFTSTELGPAWMRA